MKDGKYYLDQLNKVLSLGFYSHSSLAKDIGISKTTIKKLFSSLDGNNMAAYTMYKVKEFIDKYERENGKQL
jgi:hypothetical protein